MGQRFALLLTHIMVWRMFELLAVEGREKRNMMGRNSGVKPMYALPAESSKEKERWFDWRIKRLSDGF